MNSYSLSMDSGYSLLHNPSTPLLIPICSVNRQNLWVAPWRVFLFHPAASKHTTAVPTAELLNCHKMDASGCCHEIRSPKYYAPRRYCNCKAYFLTIEFMLWPISMNLWVSPPFSNSFIPPDSHISINMFLGQQWTSGLSPGHGHYMWLGLILKWAVERQISQQHQSPGAI